MKLLILSLLISSSVYSAEVLSILRSGIRTNPTNAEMVQFTVNFSAEVFNVQTSDFQLRTIGRLSSGQIVDVSSLDNKTYKVDVRYFQGEGRLSLILQDTDRSIVDAQNKPLARSVYNGGQSWDVDNVGPRALTMYRTVTLPVGNGYVDRYTLRFSEPAYGVSRVHFFASGQSAYIRNVFGSGNTYFIEVFKRNRTDFTYLYFRDPGRTIRDRLGNRRRD